MGPIIPALVSQFRPPLPETNSNISKGDTTEKRKRAMYTKKFRPATPRASAMCPPLLQAPPKPSNSASSAPVTVREDTPWPGTGKMSGNLFEERNWLLPKDYLVMEDKKEDATVAKPPLKEESKTGEQASSLKEEKCGWGPDCPFVKPKRKMGNISNSRSPYQSHKPKSLTL